MPIYMHFEGIDGTVTRKKKKWIELTSAQFGSNRSVTPAGRGANREASAPAVQEIVVTKQQDASSTALFRAAMWGEGKKVVIHFVKDGPHVTEREPYLVVELENTLVANFNVSGAVNGQPPVESLSLNFTRARFTNPSVGSWHDAAP